MRRDLARALVASPPQPATAPVTLVVSEGDASMDRCSQRLAHHLDVPVLRTDVYRLHGQRFGREGAAAFGRAKEELAFIARLRGAARALHFVNHHLARYADFVDAPYLVTVHDLIRFFDLRAEGEALIQRPTEADRSCLERDYAAIGNAAAVIAVSETTRRDLVAHLGLPEARVHVVHNGVDHDRLFPVRRRLWDFPYVLYVGTEQPRKNLVGLLAAFRRLVREPGLRELRLVKVGGPGSDPAFRRRTEAAVEGLGLSDRVLFAGRVDDDEMAAAFSGAACLAIPSLYEGFGLPCVEAMACGCPVVTSIAGSLPEIAADAALTVDPGDERALAAALREAMEPGTAAELRARGLRRAAQFTWERAARETMALYERFHGGVELAV